MVKKPLNENQLKSLRKLVSGKPLHELLLNLSVDLMLRGSDLMNLKVSDVISELNIRSDDRIIDLFCGLGNITLPLASRCSSVGGIESSSSSVDRARHNANKNDLRVDFFEGNLYESSFSDFLPKELQHPNKLVFDPPRLGIGQKLVEDLRGVERMVYVSCNPESFSKDAANIIKKGFALERVGIYDMFPQTAHIELMGVFQSL